MKGRGGGCGTLRFFCSGPSTHDTFPMGGCEYCHCAVTMYRAQFAAHSAYDLLFSMHPRRYPKFARVLLWLLLEVAIVGEEGLREGGREGGRTRGGDHPFCPRQAPTFPHTSIRHTPSSFLRRQVPTSRRPSAPPSRSPSCQEAPSPKAPSVPLSAAPPPTSGADIQETIGSAIALSILSGGALPLWLGCIFISITAFLLLLLDRFGFR